MTPAKRIIGALLLTFIPASLISAHEAAGSPPDQGAPAKQATTDRDVAKDHARSTTQMRTTGEVTKDHARATTQVGSTGDMTRDPAMTMAHAKYNGDAAQTLISWPAGPRLAGLEMIDKYGEPQEITDDRMIWHNPGSFKRILLTREELPHHFPIVHMDYLQHTISYDVPADKASDLLAFDGAISIYRVGGEMSARCDLESNNVLTLNLAHDIIEGRKTVEQARKEFGEAVMARTTAQGPANTKELQFKPKAPNLTAATDTVSIAGAPRPANADGVAAGADAETLALLIASDMDKVHAAMIAKNKNVAKPIQDYARMMHEDHGKHLKATVEVGKTSDVQPVVTSKVSSLHKKNAAALSDIAMLDGDEFTTAYMDLVIQGHSDGQVMIDERLAVTESEEVRNHLTQTRQTITAHLEQARDLQGETTRTVSN